MTNATPIDTDSASPATLSLAGQRALITGAAQGIGAVIAKRFIEAGATCVLLDRSPEVADTAEELGTDYVIADLADAESARMGCRTALDRLGGIDVLVNNAGVFDIVPVLDLDINTWNETMDVNVRAMLLTTQMAVPFMIEQGTGGRIINLASMAAKEPEANQAAYAASKAAVVALTSSCAKEFGEYQITVNCLCPGYVLTEMGADTRTAEMIDEWSSQSPLGRCAEPEDVADVALFYASHLAGYVTGQALNVTGGMVMH